MSLSNSETKMGRGRRTDPRNVALCYRICNLALKRALWVVPGLTEAQCQTAHKPPQPHMPIFNQSRALTLV